MKIEVYNNIIEIIRMVPVKGFPLSKECMKVLELTYPMIPECTLRSIYALFYRRKMRERHRKLCRKKQELFNRYTEAVKKGEKCGIILRMSLEVGLSPALLARFILEQAYLENLESPDDMVKNETKKFSQLSLNNSSDINKESTQSKEKCPEAKLKFDNSHEVTNSVKSWKNSNVQFMLSDGGNGFQMNEEVKDASSVSFLPVRRKVSSQVNGELSANSFSVTDKCKSPVNSLPGAEKCRNEFRCDLPVNTLSMTRKDSGEFRRDLSVNSLPQARKSSGEFRSDSPLNTLSMTIKDSGEFSGTLSQNSLPEVRKGSGELRCDSVNTFSIVKKGSGQFRGDLSVSSSPEVREGSELRGDLPLNTMSVMRKDSTESRGDLPVNYLPAGENNESSDAFPTKYSKSKSNNTSPICYNSQKIEQENSELLVDRKVFEKDSEKAQLQTQNVSNPTVYNVPFYSYVFNFSSMKDCMYGDVPEHVFKNLKWPSFSSRRHRASTRQVSTRKVNNPGKTNKEQLLHRFSQSQNSFPSSSEKQSLKLRLQSPIAGNVSKIGTSTNCVEKVINQPQIQESLQSGKRRSELKTLSIAAGIDKSEQTGNTPSISESDKVGNAVSYYKTEYLSLSSNSSNYDTTPEENCEDSSNNTFRGNSKHMCHGLFGKNSVFQSWQDQYNESIKTSKLEDEIEDKVTLSDDLKLILRKINEVKNRVGSFREGDPCSLDDTQTTVTKTDISQMMRDTTLIPDGFLACEVHLCNIFDDQYGVFSDTCKSSVGVRYEAKLSDLAKKANLIFRREDKLRDYGFDKTPDFILDIPVAVGENIVCWIESKALFADEELHNEYCVEQYDKYCIRYGPGLVIYWFGFVEDIREQNPQILIRENFPKYIKYINYELPDFMICDFPESIQKELSA